MKDNQYKKILHLVYYLKRMFEQAQTFLDEFIKDLEEGSSH